MELKRQDRRIDWKSWKFWYKFLGGLAMILVVLGSWIGGMVNINHLKSDIVGWFNSVSNQKMTLEDFKNSLINYLSNSGADLKRMNYIDVIPALGHTVTGQGHQVIESLKVEARLGEYTINTFSYFTVLSNLAIGIWMLTAAFKPKNEGIKGILSYQPTLIVITTITLTMLVFVCMLLPVKISSGDVMKPLTWLGWSVQHVVFPLLIIFYVCLVWKPQSTFTNKEYMRKGWWKIIIVILVYGIYILIRGEILYRGNAPYDVQYPYFFLRIHEAKVLGMPGAVWFVLALGIIIGICLGFSLGYNTIINKKIIKAELRLNPESSVPLEN